MIGAVMQDLAKELAKNHYKNCNGCLVTDFGIGVWRGRKVHFFQSNSEFIAERA